MQLELDYIISMPEIRMVKSSEEHIVSSIVFNHIMYDSRKQNVGSETLFVDLGDQEGHRQQAYRKGVRFFLMSHVPIRLMPSCIYLVCEDVLESLQKIALEYRAKHAAEIIAITGSNGKTITKEWLSTILGSSFRLGKSPGSYNSQLGVPLSILSLKEEVEIGIIEAGISKKGEMEKLERMIQPEIGVLTKMGDAHSEGFETFEEKLSEKLKLFKGCEKIISELFEDLEGNDFYRERKADWVTWSEPSGKGDYLVSTQKKEAYILIHFSGKIDTEFQFSLHDNASISNIILCIIVALEHNTSPADIQQQLDNIQPISMRLELMKASGNCLLINDSYNSDLTSLQNALEFAIQQKHNRSLTLLLSAFDEQRNKDEFYTELQQLIQYYPVDKIYFVGDQHEFESADLYFQDTTEILNHLIKNRPQDELLLIKGARRFKFEMLADFLKENQHRTILQTRLSSIGHNIKLFKSRTRSETKIMAVVKAGAYGSDAIRVSRYVEKLGVDYLAVAYFEEGIELRNEGVKIPIMVMNPDPTLFSIGATYNLEPEIYSLEQLQALEFSSNLKIHLMIDSGMNRLGFKPEELSDLISFIKLNPLLNIASVFSHLSASDDPKSDAFTQQQKQVFDACYQTLSDALEINPLKHMCNSHGAISYPALHYDMIRVGIGLHGLIPFSELECAHRLISYVAQVKDVKEGESVGYNRAFIAPHDLKTATISIGYADGISRKHGNGNSTFFIQGKAYKTIGNVSMDTIVLDVSNSNVQQGDEVVIFETKEQFLTLCQTAGVIPYEFICGIGKRVARNSHLE